MQYKSLKCESCHNQFVWSLEEQKLYHERNLPEPKFCPICRGMMEARNKDKNRINYENTHTQKT